MPAHLETVHLIEARGLRAGVDINPDLASRLADYVELVEKWNRKINLTALPLDPPTEPAIDRLIIEPLIAAQHVGTDARVCMDVGSGGGSPAIPMALACPGLGMTMVESRGRKAAFLREAIRQVGLTKAAVENCRMEELAGRPGLAGSVDLVTIRAVWPDAELMIGVARLLRSEGRLFFFGRLELDDAWLLEREAQVDLGDGNQLEILRKGLQVVF